MCSLATRQQRALKLSFLSSVSSVTLAFNLSFFFEKRRIFSILFIVINLNYRRLITPADMFSDFKKMFPLI